jgi:hypothetical protein
MHPDPPPDTWEPDEPTELRCGGGTQGWKELRETEDRDPPFHWIDGEDEDTDGRGSLPAVGGSSDGPEPDANSGERRAPSERGRRWGREHGRGRDHTWDAAPMEWFTRLSDRLLLWGTRIGAALCVLFFLLFSWGVWKVAMWVVESLPK